MKIADKINNNQINFQAYEVKIGIRSDREFYLRLILERLAEVLPNGFEFIEESDVDHLLEIKKTSGDTYQILKQNEVLARGTIETDFINLIESQIRLTVAEFAEEKVFLHAGVVGWNEQALIIPARSFSGKTTLVAELIKKGAKYYSDEYAVLDKDGLVHPYPKKLSMRGIIDDYKQLDLTAESFGAAVGTKPIPVGMVLISGFEANLKNQKNFFPEILTPGQGMIEIIANTIPIRHNPKFVINVLNKISTRAIIAKSQRGEAELFAAHLINYLNKNFY